MSTFAATFREIVIPDLRAQVALEGALVAAGCISFSRAFAFVYGQASARGAHHLPRQVQDELEDWIATSILRETERAEQRGEAFRAWLINR